MIVENPLTCMAPIVSGKIMEKKVSFMGDALSVSSL